jgi:hypothetical protein
MQLEVLVAAITKEFRAIRAEVDEPGDVLLGVKVVIWWRWMMDMRFSFARTRLSDGRKYDDRRTFDRGAEVLCWRRVDSQGERGLIDTLV